MFSVALLYSTTVLSATIGALISKLVSSKGMEKIGGKSMEWSFLIVIGTSIWVLADAKTIGVQKGQITGFTDMGVLGWFIACLLLWIIAFPIYLAKRSEYKRINGK